MGIPSERELDAIVEVWLAANEARGVPASLERIERVRTKIASPTACLVVARRASVIGMALAEPGGRDDGRGPVVEGRAHISMLFVHPRLWRRGVGVDLLDGLHREFARRAWTQATVWTRETNAPARGLYESRAYRATGLVQTLADGDRILQYRIRLGGGAQRI